MPTSEFERLAMGHAIRRSVVFGGWWYGTAIALAGLAQLLVSAASGMRLDVGVVLMGVGLLIAGLGWLATAGLRFSRKPPTPVAGVQRAQEMNRTNIPAAWITLVTAAVVCAGILMLAPKPIAPEPVAVVAMLFTLAASICAGLVISGRITSQRQRLYGEWLAKQGPHRKNT